jgi:hypothetical protein
MFRKKKSSLVMALILLSLTGSFLNSSASSAATSYVEGTDPAAVMFNPQQVSNFSLQMTDEDYESLRYPNVSWDNEGEWRETRMSLTMAGKRYGPYVVGVHLKGAWGSWRDISGKAAFKIKMDAFVQGQTLLGVSRITLNNMVQDPSYLRETISYRLYRNLGIPAPRTGYANVSLNGIDYGLHLNVETMNKQMLKRWGHTSDQLFKGAVPWFPDLWRGSEDMFAIESGNKDDTSQLTNFMAINELSGKAWWDAISLRMDMELLTVSWASEIHSGHWDGYVRNLNNYFVNFDDNGKVMILPWGVDQTWGGSLGYTESRGIMPNKCWEYAPCLELYRQSMAKVSRVAKNLNLQTMAREVATAIRSDIISDPFGRGINNATNYQNNLVWRISDQQNVLRSIVQPFDTTIANFKVNGRIYEQGQQVFLEAGSRVVDLQVSTSQASAKAVVQPIGTLRPGLNSASVVVTSANKQHVNTTMIMLYVYTNFTTRSTPVYNKNSSVPTFAGTTSIGLLGTSVLGATNLTLTVKMAKAKTTTTTRAKAIMAARVKHLLTALEARGIKPTKVSQSLTSSGSVNALQVSAAYQK